MTNLDCTVSTCAYNKDQCCCKENIKMDGGQARHNHDTFCTSFEERRENMRSAADAGCGCGCPAKPTEVSCAATTCTFNEQCKCGASHINVAGGAACRCQETECATFRCKCD